MEIDYIFIFFQAEFSALNYQPAREFRLNGKRSLLLFVAQLFNKKQFNEKYKTPKVCGDYVRPNHYS